MKIIFLMFFLIIFIIFKVIKNRNEKAKLSKLKKELDSKSLVKDNIIICSSLDEVENTKYWNNLLKKNMRNNIINNIINNFDNTYLDNTGTDFNSFISPSGYAKNDK